MKNRSLQKTLQNRLEQMESAWSSLYAMLDGSDNSNKELFRCYKNLYKLIKMPEKSQLQLLTKKELQVLNFFKTVLKESNFHARYHLHDLIACYFSNDYRGFLETSYDDIFSAINCYFTEYINDYDEKEFKKKYWKIWKECTK